MSLTVMGQGCWYYVTQGAAASSSQQPSLKVPHGWRVGLLQFVIWLFAFTKLSCVSSLRQNHHFVLPLHWQILLKLRCFLECKEMTLGNGRLQNTFKRVWPVRRAHRIKWLSQTRFVPTVSYSTNRAVTGHKGYNNDECCVCVCVCVLI